MAIGKPLKKNFYSNGEQDIEMPPLNQAAPIMASAPDPWETQQQDNSQNIMAPVPDSAPTYEEEEYEEADQEPEETDEMEAEIAKPQPKSPVEAKDRANSRIRELAERNKKIEQERDELMRMVLMQQQQQQVQQPVKQPEPKYEEPELEDFDLEDDALVEGKAMRKMHENMKAMSKQLKHYQQQTLESQAKAAESITEAKIKAAYPDFDSVVSTENINAFKAQYPELANTLYANTDLYSKAVSAYTLIKQFGIHKSPVIDNDRIRALKNANKPRPLTSVNPQQGDTPLSKANAFANGEFTTEDSKRLYREMMQYRKNN
jgi:hypothetical protein